MAHLKLRRLSRFQEAATVIGSFHDLLVNYVAAAEVCRLGTTPLFSRRELLLPEVVSPQGAGAGIEDGFSECCEAAKVLILDRVAHEAHAGGSARQSTADILRRSLGVEPCEAETCESQDGSGVPARAVVARQRVRLCGSREGSAPTAERGAKDACAERLRNYLVSTRNRPAVAWRNALRSALGAVRGHPLTDYCELGPTNLTSMEYFFSGRRGAAGGGVDHYEHVELEFGFDNHETGIADTGHALQLVLAPGAAKPATQKVMLESRSATITYGDAFSGRLSFDPITIPVTAPGQRSRPWSAILDLKTRDGHVKRFHNVTRLYPNFPQLVSPTVVDSTSGSTSVAAAAAAYEEYANPRRRLSMSYSVAPQSCIEAFCLDAEYDTTKSFGLSVQSATGNASAVYEWLSYASMATDLYTDSSDPQLQATSRGTFDSIYTRFAYVRTPLSDGNTPATQSQVRIEVTGTADVIVFLQFWGGHEHARGCSSWLQGGEAGSGNAGWVRDDSVTGATFASGTRGPGVVFRQFFRAGSTIELGGNNGYPDSQAPLNYLIFVAKVSGKGTGIMSTKWPGTYFPWGDIRNMELRGGISWAMTALDVYQQCAAGPSASNESAQFCCNATMAELAVCAKTYCDSSSPFANQPYPGPAGSNVTFPPNDTEVSAITSSVRDVCGIQESEIEEVGGMQITVSGLQSIATTPYALRSASSSSAQHSGNSSPDGGQPVEASNNNASSPDSGGSADSWAQTLSSSPDFSSALVTEFLPTIRHLFTRLNNEWEKGLYSLEELFPITGLRLLESTCAGIFPTADAMGAGGGFFEAVGGATTSTPSSAGARSRNESHVALAMFGHAANWRFRGCVPWSALKVRIQYKMESSSGLGVQQNGTTSYTNHTPGANASMSTTEAPPPPAASSSFAVLVGTDDTPTAEAINLVGGHGDWVWSAWGSLQRNCDQSGSGPPPTDGNPPRRRLSPAQNGTYICPGGSNAGDSCSISDSQTGATHSGLCCSHITTHSDTGPAAACAAIPIQHFNTHTSVNSLQCVLPAHNATDSKCHGCGQRLLECWQTCGDAAGYCSNCDSPDGSVSGACCGPGATGANDPAVCASVAAGSDQWVVNHNWTDATAQSYHQCVLLFPATATPPPTTYPPPGGGNSSSSTLPPGGAGNQQPPDVQCTTGININVVHHGVQNALHTWDLVMSNDADTYIREKITGAYGYRNNFRLGQVPAGTIGAQDGTRNATASTYVFFNRDDRFLYLDTGNSDTLSVGAKNQVGTGTWDVDWWELSQHPTHESSQNGTVLMCVMHFGTGKYLSAAAHASLITSGNDRSNKFGFADYCSGSDTAFEIWDDGTNENRCVLQYHGGTNHTDHSHHTHENHTTASYTNHSNYNDHTPEDPNTEEQYPSFIDTVLWVNASSAHPAGVKVSIAAVEMVVDSFCSNVQSQHLLNATGSNLVRQTYEVSLGFRNLPLPALRDVIQAPSHLAWQQQHEQSVGNPDPTKTWSLGLGSEPPSSGSLRLVPNQRLFIRANDTKWQKFGRQLRYHSTFDQCRRWNKKQCWRNVEFAAAKQFRSSHDAYEYAFGPWMLYSDSERQHNYFYDSQQYGVASAFLHHPVSWRGLADASGPYGHLGLGECGLATTSNHSLDAACCPFLETLMADCAQPRCGPGSAFAQGDMQSSTDIRGLPAAKISGGFPMGNSFVSLSDASSLVNNRCKIDVSAPAESTHWIRSNVTLVFEDDVGNNQGQNTTSNTTNTASTTVFTIFSQGPTSGSDYVSVSCPTGTAVVGGSCEATGSPIQPLSQNQPFGDSEGKNGGWQCGGLATTKTVYAFCSPDIPVRLRETTGGDWTTVSCNAGERVLGGGCEPQQSPWTMQKSMKWSCGGGSWACAEDSGTESWTCGGGGTNKKVRVLCTDSWIPLQLSELNSGPDWSTVQCASGHRAIGGGCDAYVSPYTYIALRLEPTSGSGSDTFTCGGQGGGKQMHAFCFPTGGVELPVANNTGGAGADGNDRPIPRDQLKTVIQDGLAEYFPWTSGSSADPVPYTRKVVVFELKHRSVGDGVEGAQAAAPGSTSTASSSSSQQEISVDFWVGPFTDQSNANSMMNSYKNAFIDKAVPWVPNGTRFLFGSGKNGSEEIPMRLSQMRYSPSSSSIGGYNPTASGGTTALSVETVGTAARHSCPSGLVESAIREHRLPAYLPYAHNHTCQGQDPPLSVFDAASTGDDGSGDAALTVTYCKQVCDQTANCELILLNGTTPVGSVNGRPNAPVAPGSGMTSDFFDGGLQLRQCVLFGMATCTPASHGAMVKIPSNSENARFLLLRKQQNIPSANMTLVDGCEDVDECSVRGSPSSSASIAINTSVCGNSAENTCTNSQGSYSCTCGIRYRLESNRSSLAPGQGGAPAVLHSTFYNQTISYGPTCVEWPTVPIAIELNGQQLDTSFAGFDYVSSCSAQWVSFPHSFAGIEKDNSTTTPYYSCGPTNVAGAGLSIRPVSGGSSTSSTPAPKAGANTTSNFTGGPYIDSFFVRLVHLPDTVTGADATEIGLTLDTDGGASYSLILDSSTNNKYAVMKNDDISTLHSCGPNIWPTGDMTTRVPATVGIVVDRSANPQTIRATYNGAENWEGKGNCGDLSTFMGGDLARITKVTIRPEKNTVWIPHESFAANLAAAPVVTTPVAMEVNGASVYTTYDFFEFFGSCDAKFSAVSSVAAGITPMTGTNASSYYTCGEQSSNDAGVYVRAPPAPGTSTTTSAPTYITSFKSRFVHGPDHVDGPGATEMRIDVHTDGSSTYSLVLDASNNRFALWKDGSPAQPGGDCRPNNIPQVSTGTNSGVRVSALLDIEIEQQQQGSSSANNYIRAIYNGNEAWEAGPTGCSLNSLMAGDQNRITKIGLVPRVNRIWLPFESYDPIDECAAGSGDSACGVHLPAGAAAGSVNQCENRLGSYECTCGAGFRQEYVLKNTTGAGANGTTVVVTSNTSSCAAFQCPKPGLVEVAFSDRTSWDPSYLVFAHNKTCDGAMPTATWTASVPLPPGQSLADAAHISVNSTVNETSCAQNCDDSGSSCAFFILNTTWVNETMQQHVPVNGTNGTTAYHTSFSQRLEFTCGLFTGLQCLDSYPGVFQPKLVPVAPSNLTGSLQWGTATTIFRKQQDVPATNLTIDGCADIDECQADDFPLPLCGDPDFGNHCVNLHGTYNCTCGAGYVFAPRRSATNGSNTASHVSIFNDVYKQTWGPDTGPTCIEIDECWPQPCGNSSLNTCVDKVNAYECVCGPGYEHQISNDHLRRHSCVDIDECAFNNSAGTWPAHSFPFPCAHGVCTNVENGYTCSHCPHGYELGKWNAADVYRHGQYPAAREGKDVCVNIDDCKSSNNACAVFSTFNRNRCVDEVGGYECVCGAGWTRQMVLPPNSGPNATEVPICVEINECDFQPCGPPGFNIALNQEVAHTCNHIVEKLNEFYSCNCGAGFQVGYPNGNTAPVCVEIDDCAGDPCWKLPNRCYDRVGYFSCACEQPFHLQWVGGGSGGTEGARVLSGGGGGQDSDIFYVPAVVPDLSQDEAVSTAESRPGAASSTSELSVEVPAASILPSATKRRLGVTPFTSCGTDGWHCEPNSRVTNKNGVAYNSRLAYFAMVSGGYSYDSAKSMCSAGGCVNGACTTLAVLESKAGNDFVTEKLQTSWGLGVSDSLWIGLSDAASEEDWRWEDGRTARRYAADVSKNTTWSRWRDSEPNGGKHENCASMHYEGNWMDLGCNNPIPGFICSLRVFDSQPASTTPAAVSYVVPSGGFPTATFPACRCPDGQERTSLNATHDSCREIDDCVGLPCGEASYGLSHTCHDGFKVHSCQCAEGHDLKYVTATNSDGNSVQNQTCEVRNNCMPQNWCRTGSHTQNLCETTLHAHKCSCDASHGLEHRIPQSYYWDEQSVLRVRNEWHENREYCVPNSAECSHKCLQRVRAQHGEFYAAWAQLVRHESMLAVYEKAFERLVTEEDATELFHTCLYRYSVSFDKEVAGWEEMSHNQLHGANVPRSRICCRMYESFLGCRAQNCGVTSDAFSSLYKQQCNLPANLQGYITPARNLQRVGMLRGSVVLEFSQIADRNLFWAGDVSNFLSRVRDNLRLNGIFARSPLPGLDAWAKARNGTLAPFLGFVQLPDASRDTKFPVSWSGNQGSDNGGASGFVDRHVVVDYWIGPVELRDLAAVAPQIPVPELGVAVEEIAETLARHSDSFQQFQSEQELYARTACEEGTFNAAAVSAADSDQFSVHSSGSISSSTSSATTSSSVTNSNFRRLRTHTTATTGVPTTAVPASAVEESGADSCADGAGGAPCRSHDVAAHALHEGVPISSSPTNDNASSEVVRALTGPSFASLFQVPYIGGATYDDYRDPNTNTQTTCPINKCLFLRTWFGRWVQMQDTGDVGATSQAQESSEPESWECFYFRQQSTSPGVYDASGDDKFFLFSPFHSRYLWGTMADRVGSQSHAETGEMWRIHKEPAPAYWSRIIVASKEDNAAYTNLDQMSQRENGDGHMAYGANGDWEKFMIRDVHGHAACYEHSRPQGVFDGLRCEIGTEVRIKSFHDRFLHMSSSYSSTDHSPRMYLPDSPTGDDSHVFYITNCAHDKVCFRSIAHKAYIMPSDQADDPIRRSERNTIAHWSDWERFEVVPHSALNAGPTWSNKTCIRSVAHNYYLKDDNAETDPNRRDKSASGYCSDWEAWEIVDRYDDSIHRCRWFTTTTSTTVAPSSSCCALAVGVCLTLPTAECCEAAKILAVDGMAQSGYTYAQMVAAGVDSCPKPMPGGSCPSWGATGSLVPTMDAIAQQRAIVCGNGGECMQAIKNGLETLPATASVDIRNLLWRKFSLGHGPNPSYYTTNDYCANCTLLSAMSSNTIGRLGDYVQNYGDGYLCQALQDIAIVAAFAGQAYTAYRNAGGVPYCRSSMGCMSVGEPMFTASAGNFLALWADHYGWPGAWNTTNMTVPWQAYGLLPNEAAHAAALHAGCDSGMRAARTAYTQALLPVNRPLTIINAPQLAVSAINACHARLATHPTTSACILGYLNLGPMDQIACAAIQVLAVRALQEDATSPQVLAQIGVSDCWVTGYVNGLDGNNSTARASWADGNPGCESDGVTPVDAAVSESRRQLCAAAREGALASIRNFVLQDSHPISQSLKKHVGGGESGHADMCAALSTSTTTTTQDPVTSHGVWYPPELLQRAQRNGYYAGPPGCRACRDNEEFASYLDEVLTLCPDQAAARRNPAGAPGGPEPPKGGELCSCILDRGGCDQVIHESLLSKRMNAKPVKLGETVCPFHCAHYGGRQTCHSKLQAASISSNAPPQEQSSTMLSSSSTSTYPPGYNPSSSTYPPGYNFTGSTSSSMPPDGMTSSTTFAPPRLLSISGTLGGRGNNLEPGGDTKEKDPIRRPDTRRSAFSPHGEYYFAEDVFANHVRLQARDQKSLAATTTDRFLTASQENGAAPPAPRNYNIDHELKNQAFADHLPRILSHAASLERAAVSAVRSAVESQTSQHRTPVPAAYLTPEQLFKRAASASGSSGGFYDATLKDITLQPNSASMHYVHEYVVEGCPPIEVEAARHNLLSAVDAASSANEYGGSSAAASSPTRPVRTSRRRLNHEQEEPLSPQMLAVLYAADKLPVPEPTMASSTTALPPLAYTLDVRNSALTSCLRRTAHHLNVLVDTRCSAVCLRSEAGGSSSSTSSASTSSSTNSGSSASANYRRAQDETRSSSSAASSTGASQNQFVCSAETRSIVLQGPGCPSLECSDLRAQTVPGGELESLQVLYMWEPPPAAGTSSVGTSERDGNEENTNSAVPVVGVSDPAQITYTDYTSSDPLASTASPVPIQLPALSVQVNPPLSGGLRLPSGPITKAAVLGCNVPHFGPANTVMQLFCVNGAWEGSGLNGTPCFPGKACSFSPDAANSIESATCPAPPAQVFTGEQCSVRCKSTDASGAATKLHMKTSPIEESFVLPRDAQDYLSIEERNAALAESHAAARTGATTSTPAAEVSMDEPEELPVTDAPTSSFVSNYGTTLATDHTEVMSVERVCVDGELISVFELEYLRRSRGLLLAAGSAAATQLQQQELQQQQLQAVLAAITAGDTSLPPTAATVTQIQPNLFPTCLGSAEAEVEEIKVVKCQVAFDLGDDWFAHLGGLPAIDDPADYVDDTGDPLDPNEPNNQPLTTTTRAPRLIPGGGDKTMPPPPVVTAETVEELLQAPRTVTAAEKVKAAAVASNIDSIALVLRSSLGNVVSADDTMFIKSFTLNGDIVVTMGYYGRRRRRLLGLALPLPLGQEEEPGAAEREGEGASIKTLTPPGRSLSTSSSLEFDFEVKLKGADAAAKASLVQASVTNAGTNSTNTTAGGNAAGSFGAAFTQSFSTVFSVPASAITSSVSTAAEAVTLLAEKNRWVYDPWATCTNVCGAGTQTRTFYCHVGPQAFDSECPAGVTHVTVRDCEEWAGCPFEILCPVGQQYGCGWQTAMVLGITGFLTLGFLAYLVRGCRRPGGGRNYVNLEEGKKATNVTWKRTVDKESGKAKIVWDLGAGFQPGSLTQGETFDFADDMVTKKPSSDVAVFDGELTSDEKHRANEDALTADNLLLTVAADCELTRSESKGKTTEKDHDSTVALVHLRTRGKTTEEDFATTDSNSEKIELGDPAERSTFADALLARNAKDDGSDNPLSAVPYCFRVHARVDYWSASNNAYVPATIESYDAVTHTVTLLMRGGNRRQYVSFAQLGVPLQPGELAEFCPPLENNLASPGARDSSDADEHGDDEERKSNSRSWFGPCKVVQRLRQQRGYLLEDHANTGRRFVISETENVRRYLKVEDPVVVFRRGGGSKREASSASRFGIWEKAVVVEVGDCEPPELVKSAIPVGDLRIMSRLSVSRSPSVSPRKNRALAEGGVTKATDSRPITPRSKLERSMSMSPGSAAKRTRLTSVRSATANEVSGNHEREGGMDVPGGEDPGDDHEAGVGVGKASRYLLVRLLEGATGGATVWTARGDVVLPAALMDADPQKELEIVVSKSGIIAV